MSQIEVAIIGGGPAGTAAAISLARAGRSTLVIERSRYESVRIGEALPSEIRLPLTDLGLWERFLNDGHSPSPGIASTWGCPALRDRYSVFNLYGSGWHVDRRKFDIMLADAAKAQGSALLTGARTIGGERTLSGLWQLRLEVGGNPLEFYATVLIDATGRASSPVRRYGGRRIIYDRLIGLVTFTKPARMSPVIDRRMIVEATELGWWYSALLPDGRHVVTFMTDTDLLPPHRGDRQRFWLAQLRDAPSTLSRIEPDESDYEPRIVAANTSRMTAISGDSRIAIGDAAATLDPLSSQGVYLAQATGLDAAHAVDTYLRGNRRALSEYDAQVTANHRRDLDARAHYYARERRWSHSPFWQRRHESHSASV